MLIPNLSILLAERRLTISKAAQDTGISRTTLTALTSRSARGIQFDTLNRLCQYLKVTPDALFIYRPFDLALSVEGLPGPSCAVFTITSASGVKECLRMRCDVETRPATKTLPPTGDPCAPLESLRVRLRLPDAPEDAARNQRLTALLRALPASVLADLERDILAAFDHEIDPSRTPDDYSPDLLWPWDAALP